MEDRFAIETLLAPLEDGAGPDPRAGGPEAAHYFSIKDARAEARLAEREALTSGDPDATPLAAGLREWAVVAEGAAGLLAGTAKDLQLAAWATEAWLRTDGFPGVAAGFTLLAGLIERYWDEGLHPQEDEDGVESRVAPLFGLFGNADQGTLLQPLKLLPLSDHGDPPVALWTVETVRAQSARHEDPDMAEDLAARKRQQVAAMEEAIGRASPAFARETAAAVDAARAALDRLMAAIDARAPFGRFGSQVARPLEDIAALLRVHGPALADGMEDMVELVETEGAEPAIDDNAAPDRNKSAHAPMDRARALETLIEVAAFFDRNEPQSLIGETLRNVVRRAGLTAEELLAELLPDSQQRALFLLRAGIGRGDDNSY